MNVQFILFLKDIFNIEDMSEYNTYIVGEETKDEDPRIKYNDFYTFRVSHNDQFVQDKLKQGFLFEKSQGKE